MSYKSALMYDMDIIDKEIDDIDTEELKELIKISRKFSVRLMQEYDLRIEKLNR